VGSLCTLYCGPMLRRTRLARKLGWKIAVLGLAVEASATSGCSSDSCSGQNAPEMFIVFAPGASTSAIPLCTSDDVAPPATTTSIDGGILAPFAGAPQSKAAIAQCEVLCAGATAEAPCCLSQWEPDTVLCPPACTP
jgi:hypothetical protein